MNDWYYYPEIRLNIENNRRLLYWSNQRDWEFGCKKLGAIIPVFVNEFVCKQKRVRRLEFIHKQPPLHHNSRIVWYGLGGTLSHNGEFIADFRKKLQQIEPIVQHDEIDDEAVCWELTGIPGIYRRMTNQ